MRRSLDSERPAIRRPSGSVLSMAPPALAGRLEFGQALRFFLSGIRANRIEELKDRFQFSRVVILRRLANSALGPLHAANDSIDQHLNTIPRQQHCGRPID